MGLAVLKKNTQHTSQFCSSEETSSERFCIARNTITSNPESNALPWKLSEEEKLSNRMAGPKRRGRFANPSRDYSEHGNHAEERFVRMILKVTLVDMTIWKEEFDIVVKEVDSNGRVYLERVSLEWVIIVLNNLQSCTKFCYMETFSFFLIFLCLYS